MLKAFVNSLCQNQGSHEKSRAKEEFVSCNSQCRDFSVRIVHAGGREEFFQHPVPASYIMEKYSGMCVARPEVFRNPQKALLRPDEDLLMGQKYLIIPSTTARKLKDKHKERLKALASANGGNEVTDANITWEVSLDISDESVSSAKDFYTLRGKSSRGSRSSGRRSSKAKKAFVPPLPKTRAFRANAWEPSLTSVQELSP